MTLNWVVRIYAALRRQSRRRPAAVAGREADGETAMGLAVTKTFIFGVPSSATSGGGGLSVSRAIPANANVSLRPPQGHYKIPV